MSRTSPHVCNVGDCEEKSPERKSCCSMAVPVLSQLQFNVSGSNSTSNSVRTGNKVVYSF